MLTNRTAKWTNRKWIMMVFIVNFVLAMLSFLPYMLQDGGALMLAADFNAEQISFNMLANNAIKSGEVLWNWRIDLGSDFVSSFSFYMLGSPFFWITLPFPADWFPYLVGWVYMLKYAVAGVTSYCFFQRYVKNTNAFIGSMLYAFSGYQSCNMVFYHFHDVVAFFPLLLIGLDKLVHERKKGFFLFAVAINALLNYYFFIGEVIFLILYYIIRFVLGEERRTLREYAMSIGSCLLEGALGVGIAAILFLPSIYSVLQNPRVSDRISLADNLVFDAQNYLQMLRALFFPAEDMFWMSAVMHDNWYSIAAYLPLMGIALVLAYIIRRKTDWLSILLLVSAVLAACPVLNNIFVLFRSEPYRRWYYMPILFAVLATIRVLDAPQRYPWRWGAGISLVCMTAILGMIALHPNLIMVKNWYWFISVMGVASIVWLWLLLCNRNKKFYESLMALSVAGCCVVTTMLTAHCYRAAYGATTGQTTTEIYDDVVHTGDGLKDALPYRYFFWEHYTNRGMAAYLPERNSFLSTLSPSVFTLYDALGCERHNISPDGPEGTNELLSVRYYVRNDVWENPLYTSYSNGSQQIHVYEDKAALPIGFTYDTYMTQSEFLTIAPEQRAHAMLKTLVIRDADAKTVAQTLRHYDEQADGPISAESKEGDIAARSVARSQKFSYGTDYFYSEIDTQTAKYAFFSVPEDDGWNATVNGKPAEILNVNGLMAVKLEAGHNEILFHYTPTALWLGIGVSVVSLLLAAVYLYFGRHPKICAADKK